LHEVIFEADTPLGKFFDVALLIAIVLSVLAVMLESVDDIRKQYGDVLIAAEWFFTVLFTAEYVLRLICVVRARAYALSFFGIVDLLAILPTYISVLFPGAQSLAVVRALRLLRVFRVFKLGYFLTEAADLRKAVWDSRAKVVVFLATVIIIVVIVGSAMHLIEGGEEGTKFTSIPQSVYWAIVTMTTVGFGDITPQTPLGKVIASGLIIVGYSLIIVPTGFVSAELVESRRKSKQNAHTSQACRQCMREGHDADAKFCKYCGEGLTA
jgi:voltage-gated potassium channel